MALKVADIIKEAMIEIGALGDGETPSASDSQLALRRLNMMLGAWANDELMVYANTTEVFDLTPSKQVYTMGASGDFDTVRPQRIESISRIQSGTPDIESPCAILNQDQWTAIPLKQSQASAPSEVFVEYTYPLAKLSVYPVPDQAGKLSIVSQKPIASFASINDTITLPPGYDEAIMYGLAVRLCKPFGQPVDPATAQSAVNAKSKLMKTNKPEKLLRADGATRVRSNILTRK